MLCSYGFYENSLGLHANQALDRLRPGFLNQASKVLNMLHGKFQIENEQRGW